MAADDALVVFDIGSTLVTGPPRGPARRIAQACGLTDDQRRQLHAALMCLPFPDPQSVAEWIRDELGCGGAARAVEEVWSAQLSEADLIPGALDTLTALRAEGWRIALLSNIWRPYLQAVKRHLASFFDEAVPSALQIYSFEQGVAKPDRRVFELVLARGHVQPGRCVMIGDSYELDVRPALTMGMHSIWTLQDAQMERDEVIDVLDGGAPRPSRVVRSIADVDGAMIARMLESPR